MKHRDGSRSSVLPLVAFFWVKVVDPARGEGFVLIDECSSVAATSSLDPDPARCY